MKTFDCSCGRQIATAAADSALEAAYAAVLCANECDYPWRVGSIASAVLDAAEEAADKAAEMEEAAHEAAETAAVVESR